MRIAAFEMEPWECESFESLFEKHDVRFEDGPLTAETAADQADAEVISTFIYSDLSAPVLERFQNLKLIATRSTGFDHIDTEYCSEHGIKIANVPTYGENTVAEHVFALLLAISHHLIEAADRTRRGDFSQKGLCGFDLMGKTLGVIGTGNIGLHAIRIAKGFGMDVVAFDIKKNEAAARDIRFAYLDMEEVLARGDVITLHVPGSPKTAGLIGKAQFDAMKDGAVLINTARGPVVDIRAMLEALASGRLAAAGLDVLPEEPLIREEAELLRSAFKEKHNMETLLADHILLRLKNVIITPHSAFNTKEAVRRILDTTRDNIEFFVAENPQNLVV
ncbi:MAG: hydroxyacid dehydrogenase [Rhodospirillales bacterium]|nr:MAG: hydroxyacid dehydrogenase [Rhodospirillales bacterium]